MHCRRTLLLALLAATALAASDAANDTATCDSDACRPATKASLYVADRDALAVAATSSASSSGLLLPAIPATRRRSYVPPAPQGPAVNAAAVPVVNTSLPVRLIIRGNIGQRLADSLAVQGMEPAVVVPAGVEMGSAAWTAAVEPLQLLRNDSIVFFLDNPETTLLLGEWREISRKFQRSGARILLAAAQKCRRGCAFDWPVVKKNEPRYLDSSAWIGYAGDVAAMLGRIPPPSGSIAISDHHHLAAFFLAEPDRIELGMKLDSSSEVFLALAGYDDNMDASMMQMDFNYNGVNDTRLQLKISGAHPAVVLGNGNPKLLAQINNYAPMRWLPSSGCLHCRNSTSIVPNVEMYIGILVEKTAPFLDLMLQFVANQTLDKAHTHIGISILSGPSSARYLATVEEFVATFATGFAEVKVLAKDAAAYDARHVIFKAANASNASHLLFLDSSVHLMNPDAINHLLNEDVPVIAPMVLRPESAFSNVWGAADGDPDTQCADTDSECSAWAANNECETSEAWMKRHCPVSCGECVGATQDIYKFAYRRSFDYMDWVAGDRRGVWEVPFMHMAVLYRREIFSRLTSWLETTADKTAAHLDLSIAQAWSLRAAKTPLLADNQIFYGYLSSIQDYPHDKLFPDLFMAETNEPLWRIKYLHPDYVADQKLEFVQGRCWDIYNFPLFSERFCNEFINVSEDFGQWSGGAYQDKRLKGGYEPVPTRDIHFNQYGFDRTWHFLLKKYVAPVVETQWVGYKLEGRHTLDFIVKYEPTGQPFLRLHHDASTFSLNVALNRIGIDFEGGGTRFPRQNCTVLSNKMGHALVHPGRLTHQHEGLYVTKGRRYIIVSFVDQV